MTQPLKPSEKFVSGAEGIPLTRDNREAFVQYSKVYKLAESAADLIREMRAGIQDGVSATVFASWTFKELERRIFGLDRITADLVIAGIVNNEHNRISEEMIQWLYDIYREMDEENLRKLIFFVTGSRNPPV